MKTFVLGLDGGGTKTAVTAMDLNGQILFEFTAGAININGEDNANVQKNMAEIFLRLSEQVNSLPGSEVAGNSLTSARTYAPDGLKACLALCIGAAGVSNPKAAACLEMAVRHGGYGGPVSIKGDHEAALYGALKKPWGMILIAGTGSICYGKTRLNESHRTGGFGYLIDDEGSGYAIGRDILSAVVRAYDGRCPETALTPMVYDRLKLTDIGELIGFVYSGKTNKRDIAALSPLLTQALSQQDPAALDIAEKSSLELVKLVVPVAERLKLESGELALAGSILLKDPYIRKAFEEKLRLALPGIKTLSPAGSAAYGAALMARDMLKSTAY